MSTKKLDELFELAKKNWDNPVTAQQNEKCYRNLRKHFGGKTEIDQINRRSIDAFKQERLAAGRKPATINRDLAVLSGMMKLAHDYELVERRVRVPALKKNQELRDIITPSMEAEISQWFAEYASAGYLEIFVTLLYTGMRVGELFNLKRSDYDQERQYIKIRKAKNGDGRNIPVVDTVFSCMELMMELTAGYEYDDTLIPDYISRRSFNYWFDRMRTELGYDNLVIHDTRHTFITRMVQQGASPFEIMKVSGHRSINQILTYTHLAPEDTRDVMLKLDGAFKGAAVKGRDSA